MECISDFVGYECILFIVCMRVCRSKVCFRCLSISLIFKVLPIFMYLSVFHVYMSVHRMLPSAPQRPKEGVGTPWILSYEWLWATMWVLLIAELSLQPLYLIYFLRYSCSLNLGVTSWLSSQTTKSMESLSSPQDWEYGHRLGMPVFIRMLEPKLSGLYA